jgi:hypothetical protein
MSIFRFLQRNTQPSLFQQYQDYLNQAMPDISGIFSLPPKTIDPVPVDPIEEKPEAGLTPEQLRLLYPQNSGGGDDRYRGGGKFGNLDLSRSKTFTKDVYDEELGDFIPTELTAYYNPTLGNYQTFEGKNINPMFSNTGLTFGFGGGILDMLGLKSGTVGGYVPGSIRGYYDTPMDFFKRNKNEQERTIQQIAATRKADAERLAALRAMRGSIGRDRDPDPSPSFDPGQGFVDQGGQGEFGGGDQGETSSDAGFGGGNQSGESEYGGFCFDPDTLVQMADGSEKKIKEIQLGDNTKGGEVTGVFQFKASDEIHDYKGVTVAGSHYVKEDGRFIMVKDSPISVKINKIPVVYSLDTTGRRIFINDIEFADYNGDGIAKGFLTNAGVDLTGFDKEVLRQVENRLI